MFVCKKHWKVLVPLSSVQPRTVRKTELPLADRRVVGMAQALPRRRALGRKLSAGQFQRAGLRTRAFIQGGGDC